MIHATSDQLQVMHQQFLTILPRIERHANIYFRSVRCPAKKEDYVQEATALCWKWFVRLVQKGKDPMLFPSAIATYAAKAVKSGRRVTGQENAQDALSLLAQQRHDFSVNKLPDPSPQGDNSFAEVLADNAVSPVPEQVAFRIDFAAWLQSHDDHHRQVIHDLMLGERTLDMADKHQVSPGRISQLRRCFQSNWERFQEGQPSAEA